MSKNKEVSVVLVHGAFVDGAGWEGVYTTLKREGYDVSVVQNTTLSLEDDVALTKQAIAAQEHDVILKTLPPDAPAAPILPPEDGLLFIDEARFHAAFVVALVEKAAETLSHG